MPWKENNTMDLRVRLIHEYGDGESVTALADIYGVSRKTIYKWLERHQSEGLPGLADRSHAAHEVAGKLSEEMVTHIIAARQRWHWGPRKLRVKLIAAHPALTIPAASTIGDVLKRAGLTHPRRRRSRATPSPLPFAAMDAANQTWCADFKGWFLTGDGQRCDPLTISDGYSRFLLRCHITPKADGEHVAGVFEAAFREYGLPRVIHTDNGPPFASVAPGGLSRLSMSWIKLGIVPERSRPASPQDNGRHERMHSTLKQSTLRPPARDARRQQQAFDRFRQEYNHDRPHEALADQTPASCFEPSPRSMPRRVPELDYDDNTEVRRVSQQGSVRWRGERTFISEVFAYERLGLRALDERTVEVLYGPVTVGYLDSYRHEFHRQLSARVRRRLALPEAGNGVWK